MKKISSMLAIGMVLCVFSSMTVSAGTMSEGDNYETELTCGWMTIPPDIDGEIDEGEWDEAYMLEIEYESQSSEYNNDDVVLYFGNDNDYLYVGIDVTYMTYFNETTEFGCYFFINLEDDDEWSSLEGDFVFYGQEDKVVAFPDGCINHAEFTSTTNSYAKHMCFEIAIPIEHYLQEYIRPPDGTDETFATPFKSWVAFEERQWDDSFPYYVEADNFTYPIDLEIPELFTWGGNHDTDSWAEITLAVQDEPSEVEGGEYFFGLYMLVGGLIILVNILLFNKQIILENIADGKVKVLLTVIGIATTLVALGILDIVYGIGAMIGL